MINMICLVGATAALTATVARIFMGSSDTLILIMLAIVFSIGFLMFFCNHFQWYSLGIWIFLLTFCDVLLPLAFFSLGGQDSGMAAFFVLSMVVIFLFFKGKILILFLATHIALITGCYFAGFHFPLLVARLSRTYQLMDNIQSFLISGFFIGFVILFQDRIYQREKLKAELAGDQLIRQDKLLHVVNAAASLLLTADIEKFDSVIRQSLEMMARDLKVDRINIWRNIPQDHILCYNRVFSWAVDSGPANEVSQDGFIYSYRDSLPRWETILSGGHCINGPLTSLPEEEQARFKDHNLQSLLVIPVFLQNDFWGFVSFDDCRRNRIFPTDEESILRSGSLLLANALVRNEVMQTLIRAREDALSGARAKSEFLANMSHEIRTPMNAIIGMTSIAKSTEDLVRKNSCLTKIEDASTHLLGIINDVLDMSKIEANKLELSFVSFDFEKMLQRMVNVINFRIEEKHQNFSVHIDRNIPQFLIGDDRRLAQVITNLLSNSVKFTPETGGIYLNTRLIKEENGVCTIQIEITDTGIGITGEQQSRLFTSFQQASSNTSRKFGGTGLGLAISKKNCRTHGRQDRDRIRAGQGFNFRLYH